MQLLNFTIIKLTLCLILGIVISHNVGIDFRIGLSTSIALVFLIGIYWFALRNKINKTPYFAILVYLGMVSIGVNAYNIKNEKLHPKHYTNSKTFEAYQPITFKIKERLKPDAYNDKYIVSIISHNGKESTGKLLLNLKNDSLVKSLDVDDAITTTTELKGIQKPLNPHQFDYSKYLELKQVYHQLYLKPNELFLVSNKKTTIYGFSDKLRNTINQRLVAAGFDENVLSIMNALLLGQRQNIDKDIYNNYVNSGTIHILAVSGLHVGILLWILNFIFRPLLYLKYGRVLRPLIIIIILWSFAVIAGLSPSVTRAVAMFSIISFAMHLKRPTNIYNTLAISAFFILLVKPTFLFEVGFQMSYLAVLGIVSVQPIIYRLFKPKFWIFNKLWQIFTVTLAAQVGVLPISLFYFHQFPGLFFVSNLVVIPFLGAILGLGILVIALALTNLLNEFIVSAYSFIIESLNNFIARIAQFEDFLFRDIPFTLTQVICAYFIIISLLQAYKMKTFKWVVFSFIGIIAFQCTFFYNDFNNKDDAFVVFNKSRFSIIGIKQNDQLVVHHNLDSTKQVTDNVIKNYKVGELISTVKTDSLQHLYQFKNSTILVIDSFGIYKDLSFKPDLVVLRNSPRINISRLIDLLQPRKIIADASNYKSYVNRWKVSCRNKKIPFHYTYEKGAFILK